MPDLIAIKPDDYPRWLRLLRAYERGELAIPPPPEKAAAPVDMPRLRCVLLEYLYGYDTGLAAVTRRTVEGRAHDVRVVGVPTGGSFTLKISIERERFFANTPPIGWDAPASVFAVALRAAGLDARTFRVGLGSEVHDVAGQEFPVSYVPGRWSIEWRDRLAVSPPTLRVISANFASESADVQIDECDWIDSGRRLPITLDFPLDSPTPVVAGAICHCGWIESAGYCIDAVEARRFSDYLAVPYYSYGS